MAAKRRKLTDADRLAQKIAETIRDSTCDSRGVVNALIAVAAGRAVVSDTHHTCAEFEDEAHAAFHAAVKAMALREKGDRFVN